jgi:hypothetical protein
LNEKNTKAPGGMNYPCGGFKKAFLAYPLSWRNSLKRLGVTIIPIIK